MADFIKIEAIKNHITKEKKIRSEEAAVTILVASINEIMVKIIDICADKVKEADRKTIMEDDVKFALDKALAKKDLDWEEILEQVLIETPADLGNITQGIKKYIESHQ